MPVQQFSLISEWIIKGLFILATLLSVCASPAHASYLNSSGSALDWSDWEYFYTAGVIQDLGSLSIAPAEDSVSIVSNISSGLVYNYRNSLGLWNGFEFLGGQMKGNAALASGVGGVYLAIRGLDDALWVNVKESGSWSGWACWNGSIAADPVAARTSVGLDVGVKGSDGRLWLRREYSSGGLSAWFPIDGLSIKGGMSIASEDGEVLLAARNESNGIYVITRDSAGNWGAWTGLGGLGQYDPSIYKQNGIVYVSIVGIDGSLWYTRRAGGVWQQWTSLGGSLSGSPQIAGDGGSILIAAKGSDGGLWFRMNSSGGAWRDWASVPNLGVYSLFGVAGASDGFAFSVIGWDQKIYYSVYHYKQPDLTSFDLSFNDYSIANLPGGGKELSFYLSNAQYEAKVSYRVNPGENYITKKVGYALNDGISDPVYHSNPSGPDVYVSVEGSGTVFRIGNSLLERSFRVTGGRLETYAIQNKVSAKSYSVKSEEFGARFANRTAPLHIDLERITLNASITWLTGSDGFPVLYDDMFFWVKHPLYSSKTVSAGSDTYLVERMHPLTPLNASYLYSDYEAVLGVSASGGASEAYMNFLLDMRSPKDEFYYVYPTWWTVRYRVNQSMVEQNLEELDSGILDPYNVSFDAYRLDDSWTEINSIWRPDNVNFPGGLQPVADAIHSRDMKMGIWVSPSSNYPSQSKAWAGQEGYYVCSKDWYWENMCFFDAPGNRSYYSELRGRLSDYVTDYNLSHIMFDVFFPCYPDGAEEADRFLEIQRHLRDLNPDMKYELSWAFSPGYLLTVDWLLVPAGDYPPGMVPSLNYKNGYLNTRHQVWMDYVDYNVPPKFLHQYGIIIQTHDDWHDDAVSNLLVGTPYVSFWVNPAYMDAEGWRYLSGLMRWGKENQELLLHDTKFVGGRPKNGEVYGFSHFNASGNAGYLLLRNPSQEEQNYTLTLNSSLGLTEEGDYAIKIIYPYKYAYDKVYAKDDVQEINLQGFQTLVLHIKPLSEMRSEVLGARYEVVDVNGSKVLRLWGSGKEKHARIYYSEDERYENISCDYCDAPSYIRITDSAILKSSAALSGSFSINSSADYNTSLVILLNSTTVYDTENIGTYSFTIDGQAAAPAKKTSAYMGVDPDNLNRTQTKQWCDNPNLLHYWTYLVLQIPAGRHAITFSLNGLPSQPSKSAAIHYKKSLGSVDITPVSWIADPDDVLQAYQTDIEYEIIPVGTDMQYPLCGDGLCSCGEDVVRCPSDCSGSATTTTSTTTTTITTIPIQCTLRGNYPPCDEVSLQEIVDAITAWSVDEFALSDVIDLINAWAYG